MTDSEPRRKTKRYLLGGLAVGALALLAIGVAWSVFGGRSKIDRPPLPSPNGYQELAALGDQIVFEKTWLEADAGPDDWRAFVEANPTTLARAREALEQDSMVPIFFQQEDMDFQVIGNLRQLARFFSAAGRLAQEEGKFDEAARQHLDNVRLGHRIRGGLLIHRMMGFAIEGMGLSGLQELREDLDAETCRMVSRSLADLDRSREPIAETLALDQNWGMKSNGPIASMVMSWSGALQASIAGNQKRFTTINNRHEAHLRLLQTDLAIRAFQKEQGKRPETLTDLVPKYLDSVPLDPFGDGPLSYRLEGESYQLYSVGPDGINDGGKPFDGKTNWEKAKGDATLETYRYEEPAE